MADIVMSYIIIKKDNDDVIESKIIEYLDKSGFKFKDNSFILGDKIVDFDLHHKKDDDRYYLTLHSSIRFKSNVESLEIFDACLNKSDFQRYASVIRGYDGVSAVLSEKLYPLYAQYERSLRQLIVLVLTKAFGNKWIDETISRDELNDLKGKAKG